MAAQLTIWRNNAALLRLMTPPDHLWDVHAELVALADHMVRAADLTENAVEWSDADKLKQSIVEMNAGTEHLEAAVEILESLQ